MPGEEGALHAGEAAFKIGDGGKERGVTLERRFVIRAAIAGGVKAQGGKIKAQGDAAASQIGLGQRSGQRLAKGEEFARRLLPVMRLALVWGLGMRPGLGEARARSSGPRRAYRASLCVLG